MKTDIREYIPKDKFDTEKTQLLLDFNNEEIQPILFELLEWIKDMNWPVAQKMIEILPRFHRELIPLIKAVLSAEQTDEIWKYWVISALLPKLPKESLAYIIPYVERIKSKPTEREIVEEVHEVAIELFSCQE